MGELSERKVVKAALPPGKCREAAEDLSLFVRICCLCALNRGLRNLGTPCKGDVFTFFLRRAKRTKKHARTCKKLPVASFCASETAETGRIANGREQGDHVSRRRLRPATSIQIAGRYEIFAEMTGVHQVTGYAESCIFRVSPAMI